MEKAKLASGMSIAQMMHVMADGNFGAIDAVTALLGGGPIPDPSKLFLLDSFGIRGARLYRLWNDCADRDNDLLEANIRIIQCAGLEPESEIDYNLSEDHFPKSIPFVDPKLAVKGKKSAELIAERIGPTHPLFDDFAAVQVKNYRENLAARKKILAESEARIAAARASSAPYVADT